jgi:ubiquitin-like protein Pup
MSGGGTPSLTGKASGPNYNGQVPQIQRRPNPPRDDGPEPPPLPVVQAQLSDQGLDDLLADIDEVLEVNAETFVRSFVQKGGQ